MSCGLFVKSVPFSVATLCFSVFKESEAFDMMLGRLLNAGLVSQARELATLFEHDSPDLTIVMVCIPCSFKCL